MSLILLLGRNQAISTSLYSPFGISGVRNPPDTILWSKLDQNAAKILHLVVVTHAGGGKRYRHRQRGRTKSRCKRHTKIIGASVDLSGLHMASDNDFNKKSLH